MSSPRCSFSLRLDNENERLWLGTQEIRLRPKAFAVLRTLVEQPGRTVSREELVRVVWPDTKVSEVVLRGCFREIRQALGDSVQSPQFIETIPRRGWRFLPQVTSVSQRSSAQRSLRASRTSSRPSRLLSSALVGRADELALLWQELEKAQTGQRRIVFLTGELGIGKTALLDAFLAQAAASPEVYIARGQCVEQYGAGEPYLPVLEAFDHLCRTPAKKHLLPLLRQQAPLWLWQMPGLLTSYDQIRLPHSLHVASQDRMLREMVMFIEAATVKRCLILALEDLHWSDVSTLALLSSLARHHKEARVMIIGSYRSTEIARRQHALRHLVQELTHCPSYRELPLRGLDENAVSQYVAQRLPGKALPATIGKTVYQRTEGNPLFVVHMVTHLISQGLLMTRNGQWEWHDGQGTQLQGSIPDTLQHVIAGQAERLRQEEQRLLEVGSVVGMEFSAAIVAAALGEPLIAVEECCEILARHQLFLHVPGAPARQERRLATRYRFLHSLYLNVMYERLPQAKRRHLHHAIGTYKEQEYGKRAIEIAPELVTHFKEGRDYHRAAHYLALAAQTAMQRQASHEALNHLHHAQTLLATLSESPETKKQLHEVEKALQHPFLVSTKTGGQSIRRTAISQAKLRKIA